MGDFREFWIYKDYFSHTDLLSFKNTKAVKIGDTETNIVYRGYTHHIPTK